MINQTHLPSYLDQSAAVKDRFDRLKQRWYSKATLFSLG